MGMVLAVTTDEGRVSGVVTGFYLSLRFSLFCHALIVLIPRSAAFLKTFTVSWIGFLGGGQRGSRTRSHKPTFGASHSCAALKCVFGRIVARALVRYRFSSKKIVDPRAYLVGQETHQFSPSGAHSDRARCSLEKPAAA
jgi:ABC-type sulfate transport system permease component